MTPRPDHGSPTTASCTLDIGGMTCASASAASRRR
jgi:hypothetical protein